MNSFPSPILFKRDFFYFLQSPPQKTSDTIIVFLAWFPRFLLVPSVPRPFLSMCLFSVCFVSFVRLFVNLCARLLKQTSVQYVRVYTHARVRIHATLFTRTQEHMCMSEASPPLHPPPCSRPSLTSLPAVAVHAVALQQSRAASIHAARRHHPRGILRQVAKTAWVLNIFLLFFWAF